MVYLSSNEKAFHSFLNDGFESGYFKLQVKQVQRNKYKRKARTAKTNVLVFKKEQKPGMVTLFQKKNGKEIGLYNKSLNTLFTENAKDFVSLRFKLEEKKLTKATVEKSPVMEEVVEAPSMKAEEAVEVPTMKAEEVVETPTLKVEEVVETPSMKVEEVVEPTVSEEPLEVQQAPAMTQEVAPAAADRINAVKELFETDLKAAKKVWAILHNGEEVQVESKFFEDADNTFLGTSKTSVNVMDIATVKYRNKLYLG